MLSSCCISGWGVAPGAVLPQDKALEALGVTRVQPCGTRVMPVFADQSDQLRKDTSQPPFLALTQRSMPRKPFHPHSCCTLLSGNSFSPFEVVESYVCPQPYCQQYSFPQCNQTQWDLQGLGFFENQFPACLKLGNKANE